MNELIKTFESKKERNKNEKRDKLLNAAYELFSREGFSNTTIERITDEAGVAKGTFYLFFKNKFDIKDQLTINEAYKLLANSIENFDFNAPDSSPVDNFIAFIDQIIDDLNRDRNLLRIIEKNLNSGLLQAIMEDKNSEKSSFALIDDFIEKFSETFANEKFSKSEMPVLLYSIFGMVGGLSYSAIFDELPRPIDEIKPVLYRSIRLLLE